jgi:hypothetical protein
MSGWADLPIFNRLLGTQDSRLALAWKVRQDVVKVERRQYHTYVHVGHGMSPTYIMQQAEPHLSTPELLSLAQALGLLEGGGA